LPAAASAEHFFQLAQRQDSCAGAADFVPRKGLGARRGTRVTAFPAFGRCAVQRFAASRCHLWLMGWSGQAFELGEVHAGPHPGNFAYTAGGSVWWCMTWVVPARARRLTGRPMCRPIERYQSGNAGKNMEQAFQGVGRAPERSAVPWGASIGKLNSILGNLLCNRLLAGFCRGFSASNKPST